jgi:hypothetical protein
MIEYIHPRVFIDGADSGDIVSAPQNHPKREAEILAAHNTAWDGHRGRADDKATAIAVAATGMQVEQLRRDLEAALAENAELRAKLTPPLGPIVEALRGVGLYDWMAAAASKDPDVLDEIAAMNAAAAAGDVPALVENYAAIVAVFPPSAELLQSWQAVLDAAGVPPAILAFIR